MFKLIIQQYMNYLEVKYPDNMKIWINQDNMNNFKEESNDHSNSHNNS